MSYEHAWREANALVKWPHCGLCGIIRRHDDKNKPCKGVAKITLRPTTDSNKAKVLAKWPDAYCGAADFGYRIMRADNSWLSFTRDTETEAWADAARRLKEKK